nr:uncharacterized protein LOC110373306 [Helicoverpa armigera]
MGEVRACLYFSVILLCFQISVSKPFFGTRFWCEVFCEDDDVSASTTTTVSSGDYLDDFCADCPPTRRPRPPTTRMPPMPANVWMPGAPGMPPGGPGNQGPVNYFVIPPQSGANFSMAPNGGNGWWNMVFSPYNPAGPAGPAGPPSATPAPVPAPTTAAAGATPEATTAAATTAAPAARK